MTDSNDPDLNPGGSYAKRLGCTCPVLDNHYGKGIEIGGKLQFWVFEDCPLHAGGQGGDGNAQSTQLPKND